MYASAKPKPTSVSWMRRRMRCALVSRPLSSLRTRLRRRHALEVEARDLLHDVDLARDVTGAPRGDAHGPVAADLEAQALEAAALLRLLDLEPRHLLGALGPVGDRRRGLWLRAHVGVPRPAGAGQRDEQLGREARGLERRLRVTGPSPSGSKPRSAGAAARTTRMMPTGSKFAASSSTDVVDSETSVSSPPMIPAMRDRPLPVRDQEVLRLERALLPVERPQALALLRAPHADPPAGERVEVERVQRAAERVHDVVRHVDDVRDRTHARRDEPGLQPVRRRARPSTSLNRRPMYRGQPSRSSIVDLSPARLRPAPDRLPAEAPARGRRSPPPRGRCRRRRAGRAGCASSRARGRRRRAAGRR